MIPVYEPKSRAEIYARVRAFRAKMAASEEAHKLEMSKAAARRILAEVEAKMARIERAREIERQREAAIQKQIAEMPQVAVFTPWLIERCADLGVSHLDILSKKRSFSAIRHQLYREAHERFPLLSYPALGKRFNRVHTAIIRVIHGRKKMVQP